MTDLLSLAADNLISPPILFFALGLAAGLLKSDLEIPQPIAKALALYLMLAIGFKGGSAMASAGIDSRGLFTMIAGIVLSFCIPLLAFRLLRLTTALDQVTAAAVSAHYGSVSVVTFVTAVGFLAIEQTGYEPYLIAVLALMETPAILTGLALARSQGPAGSGQGRSSLRPLLREVLLNGSVIMLMGAFVIGWMTGEKGLTSVAPFVIDPFKGVLCLFLLEMGLTAARRLEGRASLRPSLILFGIYMPILGGLLGLAGAWIVGLSLGGTFLLTVLAASASYIAVPAAMRIALPEANASIYVTLSLAITFPFNVLFGIPLYFAAAEWVASG
jgi:hypothetical protein